MLAEMPDEQQWRELVNRYGTPRFVDRNWTVPGMAQDVALRECSGGIILLIFNLAGSCMFVKRPGSPEWTFPMGKIVKREGIMDAARRVAKEIAGVVIEPVGVPLCQRITVSFNDQTMQSWHMVVIAETATSDLALMLTPEAEEARFFDVLPPYRNEAMMSWMSEMHRAGTKYLRSLDVMDGV